MIQAILNPVISFSLFVSLYTVFLQALDYSLVNEVHQQIITFNNQLMQITKQPSFHLESTPRVVKQPELYQINESDNLNQNNQASDYNRILPIHFGTLLTVSRLSWQKFKGKVEAHLPYYAHIYWNIKYQLSNDVEPKLSINVQVLPKSWVRQGCKHKKLLNHQHGHLLIGYLCALEFVRRIHKSKKAINNQYVGDVFNKTLKHYQKIEKQYDDETEHMVNQEKQKEWDLWVREKLEYFKDIWNAKKERFISKQKLKQ